MERRAPLFALVLDPGRPARPFALAKPWMTVGCGSDDIPIDDPVAGSGQIGLRSDGGQVFLECAPVSAGVVVGATTVYRAILRPGERFRVGRSQIVISVSAVPARAQTMAMVRASARGALVFAQPRLAHLATLVAMVRGQPRARRLALAAASALLLSLVVSTRVTVDAPCEIAPQARAWVRAPVAGFVREVRVREGDRVRLGDLLLVVAAPDVDRELERLRHEIDGARAALQQATRGPRATELLMAQARERAARSRAGYLERQRGRIGRLARQGIESRQALEDASRDAATARAEAELATLQVQHLELGVGPEEIEQRRAALAKLEADRDFYERQRGTALIRSPADGVVATPHLSELVSKYVTPGAELLLVFDGREMVFEAQVPEKEIEFVKSGAVARLRLKGDPQHPVDGAVEAIAPHATETPFGRVVAVRCRAAQVPPEALAGLTGVAQIHGPRVSVLGLFWKRLHRWVRTDLL